MTALPLRKNRDFVLLQAGQALSTLGTESSALAYPLLTLALTHSPAKAGIVGFARVARIRSSPSSRASRSTAGTASA